MRYRDGLITTLAGAAIPYGYTVVIWSSGSVVGERHGRPDVWDVALFAAGASVAYALLHSLVRGAEVHREQWIGQHGVFQTTAIQAVAIAIAIAAAAGVARMSVVWSWGVAPFVATLAYLAVLALAHAYLTAASLAFVGIAALVKGFWWGAALLAVAIVAAALGRRRAETEER